MAKRIFITGAGGYIGRLLVRALSREPGEPESITAADIRLPPPSDRAENVTYLKADVRDPGLTEILADARAETVVHLAAVVNPGPRPDRAFLHSVEVEGTRNVLEACLRAGVRKVAYTSSGAAYGYHADNPARLTEDHPLRGNPEFAYSDHTRQVEEMLAGYRERRPELAQLIFRVCTILGESTRNQITDLLDAKRVVGLRGATTPFVLVWDQDVVGALVKGIREDEAAGVYNLAGDGTLTLAEMARLMDKPYRALPVSLVRGTLRVLKALGRTPYGPEQVDFLRYRPVLDNTRLKEVFGYRPQKTTREVFQHFLACRRRLTDR
jgi:UDP-glucose 4-epimerase